MVLPSPEWIWQRVESPWFWVLGALAGAIAAVAFRSWPRMSAARFRSFVGDLGRLPDCAALGALGLVAYAMLPQAAHGDMPVGFDHGVHLFRAWEMRERLMHGGWPWGWSNLWFAGYPSGYLYPIASDIIIAAFSIVLLPLATFAQAYAFTFFAFFAFQGAAVYVFARQSFGRVVSWVAAVLYMTDGGAIEAGGWVWSVDYGVWPVALSVAFTMMALAFFFRAMRSGRASDTAWFGIFMGWSLLGHPLQIVGWTFLLPSALVATVLASPLSNRRRIVRVAVPGTLLGLGIGALWLMPFLSASRYTTSMGTRWHTLGSAGLALHDANLLGGTWSVVQVLGAVGTLLLLRSRRPASLVAPIAIVGVLFFGSTSFIEAIGLPKVYPVFENLLIGRFQMIIKPFWFIAAAVALAACWHGAHKAFGVRDDLQATGTSSTATAMLLGTVIGGLVLPFGVSFLAATWKNQVLRSSSFASSRTDDVDRRELVEWARAQNAKHDGFFRIGHVRNEPLPHDVVELGTQIPIPLYKMDLMPTTYYKYKVCSSAAEILTAVNVKYIFSPLTLDRPDFTLLRQFGHTNLYEFTGYTPDPFAVTEGQGAVRLDRFDPEDIVVVAPPGSFGTLRLNVSYFPRWHAYRDGVEVPITPTRVADDPATGFMTVKLEPGTYRFVFRRNAVDVVALVLFSLASAFSIVMIVCRKRLYPTRNKENFFGQRSFWPAGLKL